MVARAGVTTALDMSGPIEKLLDEFSCANVGINVAALNAILPGRNISGNNPAREQLRNFINLSRRSGALGVKLLGGHFPLTPEASHRMVETADDSHCYMAWHVGTTEKGSDIEGLLEAAEIAAGHPLHLPHVNAYCRGRVRPVLEECSIAEKVILEHPEFTTESYLSARNGAPLDCDAAGKPRSAITAGTLTRFGFESSASGIEAAIRAGRLAVLFPNQSEITLLTGTDAVAYLRAHREHCDGSFDGVNPLESRVFFASQKRPDRTFLVDAISTDGGGIPRNVILQNGLSLVELGALTTIEFARKTSLLPAQMLGLKNKGRLLAGMDADLTIYEGRTYKDYQAFLKEFPDTRVTEMDTVLGCEGSKKVLLTLHFDCCSLMMAYLLDSKEVCHVKAIFDSIERSLGTFSFSSVFSLVLTDRGGEFRNPAALECGQENLIRTSIYYCDPMCSWQKPHCEKNHEYIRKICPKGTSFDDYSQEDITLMMSHINSSPRQSLGGMSPLKLAKLMLPSEVIDYFGLTEIPDDEIVLTPALLQK